MGARPFMVLLAFAFLPVTAAVAGQEIVQLSPGTYMIIRDSKAGAFASMAKLKAETIAAANSFASSQGKVAIPISSKETRAVPFTFRWPTFEYQFRLVEPDDPAAKATGLTSPTRDGVSAALDAEASTQPPPVTPTEATDIYTQLSKLDELRQKGIVTQEEFDAQKKKILASD